MPWSTSSPSTGVVEEAWSASWPWAADVCSGEAPVNARTDPPGPVRLMTVRAMICCCVTARSDRPRPRNVMLHLSSVVIRFLKPTRYSRCTASHSTHATKPDRLNRPTLATAWKREMVAIDPLSL